MQFLRFALVFLLLANYLLTGCSAPANTNTTGNSAAGNSANVNHTGPKDNVEEFGLLVRLPFVPEEVAWEEKPEQKRLTAVIRFSSADAEKMSAEIAKNGSPSAEAVTVESWFPNELIAQGELTGESSVKGRSYPATPFLNPPYTAGKITRIENTDYFILQISS